MEEILSLEVRLMHVSLMEWGIQAPTRGWKGGRGNDAERTTGEAHLDITESFIAILTHLDVPLSLGYYDKQFSRANVSR